MEQYAHFSTALDRQERAGSRGSLHRSSGPLCLPSFPPAGAGARAGREEGLCSGDAVTSDRVRHTVHVSGLAFLMNVLFSSARAHVCVCVCLCVR